MSVQPVENEQQEPAKIFPFNNLFLLSGLTSGRNQAWMYFLGILMMMMGYAGFQMIWITPLYQRLIALGYTENDVRANESLVYDYQALSVDRNLIYGLELGMFVFAFIGLYAVIRFIHQKSLHSVMTGWDRFRFRYFFAAFSIWGVLIIAGLFLSLVLEPDELQWSFQPKGFAVSLLLTLFLMPVQTGLEELIFRGYLLQGLSILTRRGWIALLITSLLFATAHMTNPEVKAYGMVLMFSYYFLFALFLGTLTLISEGIELALGIHLANNMISSILISAPDSVIKTYSLFETKTVNPGAELVVWFVMALITFFVLFRIFRLNRFNLIIK